MSERTTQLVASEPAGRATTGRADPRIYQISVLAALLVYGATILDFGIRPSAAAVIVASALLTQAIGMRLRGLAGFDPRSALISALSLCLLLRTGSDWTAAAAAVVAVGSKFVLRFDGRHVVNPSALGIAAALLFADDAWVSGGQWGTAPLVCLWVVGLGSLVVRRAERSDVTWAFLIAYVSLLLGRALWLGDPIGVPLHALRSGALLVFAFFMISDPRTAPASRPGRIAFAVAVAAGALFTRYGLYQTNALIWALVACSVLTPLIDRVLPNPGRPHTWPKPGARRDRTTGGTRDETNPACAPAWPGLAARP